MTPEQMDEFARDVVQFARHISSQQAREFCDKWQQRLTLAITSSTNVRVEPLAKPIDTAADLARMARELAEGGVAVWDENDWRHWCWQSADELVTHLADYPTAIRAAHAEMMAERKEAGRE